MQRPANDPSVQPEVLQAANLRLPGRLHGFTTRRGGVSRGPFAQLNFSPKWPEERDAVAENHRRLAALAGYDPDRLYLVFQVHGNAGVVVDEQPTAAVQKTHADYLVTREPGVTLGVITADCVPILIADRRRPAVAAVHAGWRGLVAGVIEAAVQALCEHSGSTGPDLVAALGPSIGPCCFEVGPEVVYEFREAFPTMPDIVHHAAAGARPHVDLWAAAQAALSRAGLDPAAIEAPCGCTHCQAERFHSYRREGPRVGQQLSFIGIAG